MNRLFSRFAKFSKRTAMKQARPPLQTTSWAKARPQLETLEDRLVPSAITFVKNIGTAAQFLVGQTSLSVPVPTSGVAAGHDVFVEFATDLDAGTITVTDSAGNVYSKDVDVASTSGLVRRTIIFSSLGVRPLPGGDAVTVAFSTGLTATAMSVFEFAGVSGIGGLDQTSTNTNGLLPDSAPSSGTAPATRQANELLLGGFGVLQALSVGFTPGPGYTALARAGTSLGVGDITVDPEYEIVSATGTYQASGTIGLVGLWAGALATYKADLATHLNISLSPVNPTSGAPCVVTVTAVDAAGNTDPGYTGTVHFSSSDPLAQLPADYTFTAGDQRRH